MTTDESIRPADLERFLTGRQEETQDETSMSLEELSPRHLIVVATSTQGHLDELDGELDWEQLIAALDALPEDEQARWLRELIRRLGPVSGLGIETGIRELGSHAYELRHRHPHIYTCYLRELRRLLRTEEDTEIGTAAEEQFRRLAAENDRTSDERTEEFYQQDLRDRLVDPNLGSESRISLLETLADDSVEELRPDIVIDVLYPLRNHYDSAVEVAALGVIESWAVELDGTVPDDEIIQSLEATLAGEDADLSSELVIELLLSGYVGPAVINWLRNLPNVSDRQHIVSAAFDALHPIPGLLEYSDAICTFILAHSHEDDTIQAGIDLLESLLLGLSPDQPTEQPAQDDHIRRVFFTDEELGFDRTIRDTFRTIVRDESYSREIRAHALKTWLSARPPETHDVLWEIDAGGIGDDPLVEAKLEAVAEHRLIEFVDVIEEMWDEVSDDAAKQEQLVDTLSQLGIREIVQILLSPAFDYDNPALRDAAQEALSENGYEAELVRERQRRRLLEYIEARYEAMAAVTDTDQEIRNRKHERLAVEADRKQAQVTASEALSQSVDELTQFRAQGTTIVFQLAAEFDTLEELAQQIDELRVEQVELQNQVQDERDEADRIATELQSVENDIDRTESDLADAEREREQLQNEIPQLERRITELETDVNRLEGEIRGHERQEPSPPVIDDEDRQREYERNHREWERQLEQLRGNLESTRAELQSTEDDLRQARERNRELQNTIRDFRNQLEQLRNRHAELSIELDESNQRIDQYTTRLEEITQQLQQLNTEYEQCQQRIDQSIDQLSAHRQEMENERSSLTQQYQEASSAAADARSQLQSLADAQSSARDDRHDQNERIQQLEEQVTTGHEEFDEAGQRTRVESIEADERAFQASRHRANQEYIENVNRWRLDSVLRRAIDADVINDLVSELEELDHENWGAER
jgi:predicted  nucleic acid-binding Zn-ribbon protein